ncbi:hypothetical protein [Clostridium tunisiense]|uniref:hypothetical protein n=1 Tax=Clostridium tunisiense TaxID=219748 RepID=UPI000368B535|nr:hypothetical protein [Clostridium tunisiense]
MKKTFYSTIIIVYSIICIYIMIEHNVPNKDINHNITIVKKEQKESLEKDKKNVWDESTESAVNNSKGRNEEELVSSYNSRDLIQGNDDESDSDSYKKDKSVSIMRNTMEELSELENSDKITGEFDAYNIEQRKKNQVIKVPVEEISSYLSLEEKAKILSVSRKLKEEDLNRFQEYLSYKNQKIGVRQAMAILEERLTAKQVSEVKEIFSKYIDMGTVENKDD